MNSNLDITRILHKMFGWLYKYNIFSLNLVTSLYLFYINNKHVFLILFLLNLIIFISCFEYIQQKILIFRQKSKSKQTFHQISNNIMNDCLARIMMSLALIFEILIIIILFRTKNQYNGIFLLLYLVAFVIVMVRVLVHKDEMKKIIKIIFKN